MEWTMRYFIVFLAAALACNVFTGCNRATLQYDAGEIANFATGKTSGVITKQSRGSFMLKEASGEERRFETMRATSFVPAQYRTQEGDKVEVVYQELWKDTSGPGFRVMQVKSIEAAPDNEIFKNPLKGEIVSMAGGSAQYVTSVILKLSDKNVGVQVYLPRSMISFGKDKKRIFPNEIAWDLAVGKKAKIQAHKAPMNIGNSYVYVVDEIEVYGLD